MVRALNYTDIKRRNQRLVLDAIFASDTTSRTKLSQKLSLSKPAISDNLEALLKLGIVTEAGVGASGASGGRKSILLHFEPAHRYIIAVNLNFSNPVFAAADLRGNIVNSFNISIPQGMSVQSCMKLVVDSIQILLHSLGDSAESVYCVAVAAPGTFDQDGRLISFNTGCGGPAWWKVNLKEEVSRATGLPVIVYNDVKAATLGEWAYDKDAAHPNMLYLSVGLGIGSGLILGKRPFLGEEYNAGEIFDYIDPSAPSPGVALEDTVCIDYLKEQCLRRCPAIFPPRQVLTITNIIDAYRRGQPEVVDLLDSICRQLANIAYNYMCFLSIRYMVFGGEYAPFFDCFSRNLFRLYQEKSRPAPMVRCTRLQELASVQGMIVLAREQYFDDICSR